MVIGIGFCFRQLSLACPVIPKSWRGADICRHQNMFDFNMEEKGFANGVARKHKKTIITCHTGLLIQIPFRCGLRHAASK